MDFRELELDFLEDLKHEYQLDILRKLFIYLKLDFEKVWLGKTSSDWNLLPNAEKGDLQTQEDVEHFLQEHYVELQDYVAYTEEQDVDFDIEFLFIRLIDEILLFKERIEN